MRITIHATIENADDSSASEVVQIGEVTRDAGVDPASGLGRFYAARAFTHAAASVALSRGTAPPSLLSRTH